MGHFKTACFAITALAIIASFLAFPLLPAVVPTHWNAAGQIDGYGSSWVGAFMLPGIMVFVLLLLLLIPKIAVFKKNLEEFEKQYWALGFALEFFFILFYAITLMPNFGISFNFSQLFMLPVSMLFISIGVLMPSFKRNFFVGIRTPWTLADDKVWKKTHKFGGKAFVLAGLAILLSIPFPEASVSVTVVAALAAALGSVVYSFILFRKQGKNRL